MFAALMKIPLNNEHSMFAAFMKIPLDNEHSMFAAFMKIPLSQDLIDNTQTHKCVT
jgi:hypothetical protein